MENSTFESNELSLACALCSAHPDVHCQSDDAFLCYACDARVHRANFLVARHARAVLCRRCKTPTQVHVSGPTVDRALISTCHECANGVNVVAADDVEESVSGSDSDSESGSCLDLNSSPEEEDEEGDIHVVPASIENTVTGWKRTRASSGLDDQVYIILTFNSTFGGGYNPLLHIRSELCGVTELRRRRHIVELRL